MTSTNLMDVPQEFLRLFKEGKDAARAGENKKAHELFRQAIEIDPYREQAWLWLASVVETDEDRRVCFENVLELNPGNTTARRQLQKLEERIVQETLGSQAGRSKHKSSKRRDKKAAQSSRGKWSFRLMLVTLIIFLSIIAVLVVNYT